MKTTARPKLTADEIRAGLLELGLKEEEKPIPGYAFTFTVTPDTAMWSYQMHYKQLPTRFYVDRRTYILSD